MTRRAAVPAPPAKLFLAAFFLQSAWNYERQQGIGFAAALAGTVGRLGIAGAERARFLRRHLRSFNTNPVMAPWVIGAVARLESNRARDGSPDEDGIDRLKTALSIHLARIGDSIVWSGVRPLASAVGIVLALAGAAWVAAAVYWVLYNAVQVPLRVAGLWIGYREGAAVTARLVSPKWNRVLGSIRAAGAVVSGVGAGLLAARAAAHGVGTLTVAFVAGGAAVLVLERRRGGATGVALVVLVVTAVLAAVGLR